MISKVVWLLAWLGVLDFFQAQRYIETPRTFCINVVYCDWWDYPHFIHAKPELFILRENPLEWEAELEYLQPVRNSFTLNNFDKFDIFEILESMRF